jgi:hypothetical protein
MAHGQQPASAPTTTRQAGIMDPVLQMQAFSLRVPADWIFEGALVPGSPCAAMPGAVFRALSPDGITGIKMLPELDWSWSVPPTASPEKPGGACLRFDRELPAAEFVKDMAGVLQVEFVREEPVPAAMAAAFQEKMKKQNESFAAQTPAGKPVFRITRYETSIALVHYSINTIPVEEWLTATLRCSDAPFGIGKGVQHRHTCTASVLRSRARPGELEASKEQFQSVSESMLVDQQWMKKWMDRNASQEGLSANTDRWGDHIQPSREQRAQDALASALHTRQYEEFMSGTRRSTDLVMARPQETTEARRNTGDWADYVFDLLKRPDPNIGSIIAVPLQYAYTWVDEQGQHYQTNDFNDNPNGRLKGAWTRQRNDR